MPEWMRTVASYRLRVTGSGLTIHQFTWRNDDGREPPRVAMGKIGGKVR